MIHLKEHFKALALNDFTVRITDCPLLFQNVLVYHSNLAPPVISFSVFMLYFFFFLFTKSSF